MTIQQTIFTDYLNNTPSTRGLKPGMSKLIKSEVFISSGTQGKKKITFSMHIAWLCAPSVMEMIMEAATSVARQESLWNYSQFKFLTTQIFLSSPRESEIWKTIRTRKQNDDSCPWMNTGIWIFIWRKDWLPTSEILVMPATNGPWNWERPELFCTVRDVLVWSCGINVDLRKVVLKE